MSAAHEGRTRARGPRLELAILATLAMWALAFVFWFALVGRAPAHAEDGIASVYTTSSSGSRTASGIRLDDSAFTAAHRSLPFGTKVNVTNKANGRSVVVAITDRGPFKRGRVIDLTSAAARALGMGGLARVRILVVTAPQKSAARSADAEPTFDARFDAAFPWRPAGVRP